MTVFYSVLVVIIALAVINFATLWWVVGLQKRLRVARVPSPVATPEAAKPTLSPETVARLRQEAETELKAVMSLANKNLGEELGNTSQKLNQHVEDLAEKIIQDELTKYQKTLEELRQASIETLSQVQNDVNSRREKLEADLEAQVAEEKQHVMDQFDTKIGDVMAAYLTEVLGNEVDLGAQSAYLIKALEDHKADLKKAILSEP